MKKPILRKITEIEDRATGDYFEEYQFRKSDGSLRTVQIRPSEARDKRSFKGRLLNAGAILPRTDDLANDLVERAVSSKPRSKVIFAERTGWLPRRRGFVRTRSFIGPHSGGIAGIRASHWEDSQGSTSYRGTAARWSDTVGEMAKDSSFIMTAICAAFAAPLLTMRSQTSFAICLSGPSRSGKTVAISTAASVIGCKDRDHLLTWNLTNAHLEERLPAFNDSLFPIDDLEVISGTARDRYMRIRELAYRVAQGKGKGRSALYEPGHVGKNWRSILLTSAETSVADLAASSGHKRNDGELVRLIDVPVTTKRVSHILDLSSNAKSAKLRTRHFRELTEACRENHGAVFRRYINKLISLGKRCEVYIEQRTNYFMLRTVKKANGPLAYDLAQKFALLFAGGCLAIKFKLLPWTRTELLAAIGKSFRSALALLPDKHVLLVRGQKAMNSLFDKLHAKEELERGRFHRVEGYKTKRGSRDVFMIKRNRLHAIFESKEQRNLVLGWLITTKQLSLTSSAKGRNIAKHQHMWPDGKRRRSYQIVVSRTQRSAPRSSAAK